MSEASNKTSSGGGTVVANAPVVFVVLMACVAYGVWSQYTEWRDARKQANAEVTAQADVYIPKAFEAYSAKVPSVAPLTPDVVYAGKNAKIVAITREDEHTLFRDGTAWRVLAKTNAGAYFLVKYRLCEDCDSYTRGESRLELDSFNRLRELSPTDAKDWLFRAGRTKEFKEEFGADAPPRTVNG